MTYLEQVMKRQNLLALKLDGAVPEFSQTALATPAAKQYAEEQAPAVSLTNNRQPQSEEEQLLLERFDTVAANAEKIAAIRQQLVQTQLRPQERNESESGMLRRADNRSGGLVAGNTAPLESNGTAGYDTRRSMAEISRFFERDSRRYGGY